MTKDKTYDPLEGFKLLSEMWERQLNGIMYMLTDNKEFVRTAKVGLDVHSRYMELMKKNQEFFAGIMNVPTKSDVANVATLSIQVEEKIDALEEQVWGLQDHIASLNNENMETFQELIKVIKQMKTEFGYMAEELSETRKIKTDLQEIRQAIVEIRIMQVNLQELRKEFERIQEREEKRDLAEAASIDHLQEEIRELKAEIAQFSDIKKEIISLKNMMKKEKEKSKEKDLALSGAGTQK